MAPEENPASKVEHNTPRALNSAKNRRMVSISQIERATEFEQRVATDVSLTFLEELQIRIQALDEAFTSFKTEQSKIEDLDPEEFQRGERAKYEEMYFATVASLKSIHQKLNTSNDSAKESKLTEKYDHIRLPEIDLPTFSGDITTWITWFETFSAIIDTNPNLSSLSKFHYLIAKLSPSARAPIAGLKIEAENYEDALKMLKERYENKKVIAQEHILRIFNYPKLHKSSAFEIRALMDNINHHLSCLRNLQRPVDQWDDMIVTIVLFKLDSSSLAGWNEAAPVDRLPTLLELFDFLKKRCLKVEGFSLAQQNTSIFPHTHLNTTLFGQPSIPTFGAVQPFNHGSLLNQTQSMSGASFGSFGQTNQSVLFGSSTTGFGQPTASGKNDTGTATTVAHPTTSLFGQAQSAKTNSFGSFNETNHLTSVFGSACNATGSATNVTTSKPLEEDKQKGSPRDPFGQSSTPGFGAPKTSGFGYEQTATTSLFGQTQPTKTASFGLFGETNHSTSGASGCNATGSATNVTISKSLEKDNFAQPKGPSKDIFFQSPTLLCDTAKKSGFGLGQTVPQSTTSLCRETKPTYTFGFGSFGQVNHPASISASSTTTFWQPTACVSNATGSALVKYQPTMGSDTLMKGGTPTHVTTKQHCITAMKEYEAKSLEELRMEDNFAKQKVLQTGIFGQLSSPVLCNAGAKPQTSMFNTQMSSFDISRQQAQYTLTEHNKICLQSADNLFRVSTPDNSHEKSSTKSPYFVGLSASRFSSSANDKNSALKQTPSLCFNKTVKRATSPGNMDCSPLRCSNKKETLFNQKPFSFTLGPANLLGYKTHEITSRENTIPLASTGDTISKDCTNRTNTSNESSNSRSQPSISLQKFIINVCNKPKDQTAPITTETTNIRQRQRSKSFSGIIPQKYKDEATRYRELGVYPKDFTKVYQ